MADDRAARAGATLGSLLPAALVPGLGFLFFTSTGRDDAYITYWAAKSLAQTGEITNYNGERVEQSSSLLQTLLLAALNRITTLSMPTLGIVLGVVAGALTVVAAARLSEQVKPGSGVTAALLTGVSPFLVYWSLGGLEAPVVALLLVLTVWAAARTVLDPSTRSVLVLAAAAAGFVMVRPEGELVLGCAAVAAVLLALTPWAPATERPRERGLPARRWFGPVLVLAVGLVAALVLTGWRELYFGAAVPRPVAAKVGGVRVGEGLHYLRLWWWHWWMVPLLVAGAVGVVLLVRRRQWFATMLVLFTGGYGGFVVSTGGDWMEAGRFLVPLVPLVAILTAVALREISSAALRRGAAAALVATQLVGVWWVAANWSTGRPAWSDITSALPSADVARAEAAPWYESSNRVHFRDTAFLDHLDQVIDELSGRQATVTVASGQAGMLPYYFMEDRGGSVVFIDRGSITANTFDRCSHALVRSSLGAAMSLGYWLRHTTECGVPAPDVVYGLGQFGGTPALAGRYTLAYQQPAVPVSPDTSHLRGVPASAAEYVAVRNDLLPLATSSR
jgi:hypothetical protein